MTDTPTAGLEKRLREIAARVAAASAGEWRAKAIRYGAWAVDTELMCINGLKAWFGVAVVHAVDDHERLMTEGGKHDSRHDAELIAKAKEDISFLLEAVALLQSAVRCKDAAIESLVADKIQAADALAKARVALEAVFIECEAHDELGSRVWTECPICQQGPQCTHQHDCPIGAALEAMK